MQKTLKEIPPIANHGPVLELIEQLCQALSSEKVNYCHWKSNAALDRSASGLNDLDLLVDPQDNGKFITILHTLGFKGSRSPAEVEVPGVQNYYACDRTTGILVNVHSHFQLIVGHDYTKNFHIPVENRYLASSVQAGLFRIPAPEYELILLVLRMVIKHCTWDTFLLRQDKLSSSELKELRYLNERISESRLYEILGKDFKPIDPTVFKNCLRVLLAPASTWKRLFVGQKMIRYLAPFARKPLWIDACLKFRFRFTWPFKRRVLHKETRKRIGEAGLMVAIVGGDGAGKTTVVNSLFQWLSAEFAAQKFHMGKPKWSWRTRFVRGILKIGRSVGLYPFQRTEIKYTHDKEQLLFPGYPWMFREVCTARDRYLTYKKASRLVSDGGIVILDRFPLPQVKFMDGPQITRMTDQIKTNWLIRRLARTEENYYRCMKPPDLLIVLRVDPQIAAQRKTDELQENVYPRSKEIWNIDWNQTPAHVIDASQSRETVLGKVKELVWSKL